MAGGAIATRTITTKGKTVAYMHKKWLEEEGDGHDKGDKRHDRSRCGRHFFAYSPYVAEYLVRAFCNADSACIINLAPIPSSLPANSVP
jgi:hypothetical protein